MLNELKDDALQRMQKAVDNVSANLSRLRTGRAQPSLLEGVIVDYYGTPTELRQLANIASEGPQTLTVQPYDANALANVEKALRTSDLGLNPAAHGNLLRVPLPPLTEERRREYVKMAKQEAEQGKIAIRNIRRDVNQDIKALTKEKDCSEDEAKRMEEQIQQLTNQFVSKIDDALSEKEKELLAV